MGPVPEPVPSSNLSDEEMPSHPPIVIESDEEEDFSDDQLANYPPGYIPIQQHIEIQWQSDSEDNEVEDSTELENNAAISTLPDPEEIDYSNVSSLMAALNTHGPTVVEDQWGLGGAFTEASGPVASEATAATRESNLDQALRRIRMKAVATSGQEDSSGKEFNSSPLTEEKEEAVKKAMQGFLLPPSAIPSWAENLEDDDLSALVKEKLNTH